MKKIALISLVSALSCTSFVYAGEMGGASNCCSPFVSLEGGYTLNKINGYEYTTTPVTTTIESVKKSNHYTARLAAGMINMIDEDFGVTGELGWGYYGRTTLTPPVGLAITIPAALSDRYTLTGFDVLVGGAFVQPNYSLSLKVGAMIQNMQQNDSAYSSGIVSISSISTKTNETAVLPELKLGAAYNIDSNWGITGSYLFAYGATTATTINYNTALAQYALTVDTQNPMTNTLLLGIQYTV